MSRAFTLLQNHFGNNPVCSKHMHSPRKSTPKSTGIPLKGRNKQLHDRVLSSSRRSSSESTCVDSCTETERGSQFAETKPSRVLETLNALIHSRGWDVVSTLSIKEDCGVFIVSQPEHNSRYRVIRLSPYSDDHSASQFCDAFYQSNCPVLPQMEESQIVCVGDDDLEEDDFVLEEYEFVRNPDSRGSSDFLCFLNQETHCSALTWKYVVDIIHAAAYLSHANWCHGDISIENVVCGPTHAKLIDFESSMEYVPGVGYPATGFGPTKILYRPPELDFKDSLFYPEYVDAWSIGVILFVVAAKKFPFSDDTQARDNEFEFIRRNGFKQFLSEYHTDVSFQPLFQDLLHRIFVVFQSVDVGDGFFECRVDPSHPRLRSSEILQHAFFSSSGLY